MLLLMSDKNAKCCVVFTTTDKKNIAKLIANELILKKLAACVQIHEVESFFEYNGKVSNIEEFRLIIKAKSADYKNIEKSITSIHNYELPQIIKLDITEGLPSYLNWLCE